MTGRQDGTVRLEGVVVSQNRERVHRRNVRGTTLGARFRSDINAGLAVFRYAFGKWNTSLPVQVDGRIT